MFETVLQQQKKGRENNCKGTTTTESKCDQIGVKLGKLEMKITIENKKKRSKDNKLKSSTKLEMGSEKCTKRERERDTKIDA